MKPTLFLLIPALCLQTNASCQMKNYNNKGKIKIQAEKTVLTITGVEKRVENKLLLPGLAVAAESILPPVASLVVKAIQEKAGKNAQAYTGTYKGFVSGEGFYPGPGRLSLPQVNIKRTILTGEGQSKTAVDLDLLPELSADKTAFRFAVSDKCMYNYAIAKTKKKYDYIDLSLEITFKSISVDKGQYQISELRTTSIFLPMILVGQTSRLTAKATSGWIPLPPHSNFSTVKKEETQKEEKRVIKTGPGDKKDSTTEITFNTQYNVEGYGELNNNTGLYEIEITATETNPYKIKAENRANLIEKTASPSTEVLKALIETMAEAEKEKEQQQQGNNKK